MPFYYKNIKCDTLAELRALRDQDSRYASRKSEIEYLRADVALSRQQRSLRSSPELPTVRSAAGRRVSVRDGQRASSFARRLVSMVARSWGFTGVVFDGNLRMKAEARRGCRCNSGAEVPRPRTGPHEGLHRGAEDATRAHGTLHTMLNVAPQRRTCS